MKVTDKANYAVPTLDQTLDQKPSSSIDSTFGSKFDPNFDPMMDSSQEFLQNPYPCLRSMRDRAAIRWSEKGNHWIVTGMDEANIILRSKHFGKRLERWKNPNFFMRLVQKFGGKFGTQNILRQDPPEHTRVRGLVSSAFTPSVIRTLEPKILATTDALISELSKCEKADLISQFAFPLPITVIADLLGVPSADRERFKQWSTAITGSLQGNVCPYKITKSLGASFELRKYLRAMVAKKLQEPDGSLLSNLSQINSVDEGKLSENEMIANSILILIAGHETTVNLIGNGMNYLLRDKSTCERLRKNSELIDAAVEEILRYDSPVQIVRRIANEDTEVGGVAILKDQAVTIMTGGCNRDPRTFSDPDHFDIDRANKKHVSFGAGIHYCLGAELARTEARIAISRLLESFPNMEVEPEPMPYRGPFALRGLRYLTVGPNARG